MKNRHEKALILEKMFISNHDKELTELIEKQKSDRDQTFSLSSLSGITNRSVLDNAIKLGMNASTFSALCLIPLLKVAWADKLCDQQERHVILGFASESGIKKESPAYKLLGSWLEKDVNPNLFIAWKEYITSLQDTLTQVEMNEFKHEIIGRAITVAKASGGVLGIGSISDVEENVLQELDELFKD
jgi:hypothetical protein